MSTSSDDSWGCIIGLIAIVVAGAWAYDHYEIRKKDKTPVALASMPPPIRPTGMVELSKTDTGTWTLNADSVSGPRSARQGWVTSTSKSKKGYTQTLYRTDCATTATLVVSWAEYDAKGDNIKNGGAAKDAQPDYYPPYTLGQNAVREICRDAYGK